MGPTASSHETSCGAYFPAISPRWPLSRDTSFIEPSPTRLIFFEISAILIGFL